MDIWSWEIQIGDESGWLGSWGLHKIRSGEAKAPFYSHRWSFIHCGHHHCRWLCSEEFLSLEEFLRSIPWYHSIVVNSDHSWGVTTHIVPTLLQYIPGKCDSELWLSSMLSIVLAECETQEKPQLSELHTDCLQQTAGILRIYLALFLFYNFFKVQLSVFNAQKCLV